MKKFVATVLVVVTAVSMTACGSKVAENTVHSVDDLPGKTIGVQLGTTGDIYASDYEAEGSTIERYNKGNDAVQALKQGKLDCVIIDEQPAKAFVEKNDDLTILEEEFTLEEYAICVAKENTDLTAAINAALVEMKADGSLDKIISNYIGDDTKGKFPLELDPNAECPNGKLIMATNAAFEPYEFYEGEEIVGIDVDMARSVAAKLGMELQIEDMELDSIITADQSDKADIG